MAKKVKKPWQTKDVMTQIYEMNLWGGKDFDFYSGEGSHHPKIVKPYLKAIKTFLKSFEELPIICDLGCGDFNIGKHLVEYTKKYIGVDIVEALIERNKKKFNAIKLDFRCLDLAKDELPKADCIILRQVLQHLSNAEIKNIVNKLKNYKYVILTEHIPLGNFTPNKDLISGQGIRLKQNSGVNILKPPFNFKVKDKKQLDECVLENNKGRIATILFEVF
ncbi:class I SAM-dependent methyltransferase [Sabulilitoribacter arenilitoris]|uniref:Class I SAM-dependent methyltransferase n=1 Tax=Wocania arenilitoris TaxID=2044858 RepID=A0AAE3JKS2_9FLAO|nr:class I SAM-dependent methyltransferase [Wocania arenilitoris]MCF7567489.1 class I SAM-dependent methyltransferase [Wocania arenilitoris]